MTSYDIPGQESIYQEVNSLIHRGKFPHTTLISGPNGVPSLPIALEIAKQLMLEGVPEEKQEGCRYKADHLIHPDIHFSFPIKGAKNEADHFLSAFRELVSAQPFSSLQDWNRYTEGTKGSLSINAKECLAIVRRLSLKSFEGGNKVLILWGAEYLGTNGNRLLKLLEEPPPSTYFILIAEDTQRILPTIMSRCQRFSTLPISNEDLEEWLIQSRDFLPEKAKSLVGLSEGNLQELIHLADVGEVDQEIDLEEWLNAIVTSNFDSILQLSDVFKSLEKEERQFFLRTCQSKLRQACFFDDADNRIFEKLNQDLLDIDFVEYTSGLLNEMLEALDRNAHSAMLFTASSMKMWNWVKSRG